jgi:hypothetical protein
MSQTPRVPLTPNPSPSRGEGRMSAEGGLIYSSWVSAERPRRTARFRLLVKRKTVRGVFGMPRNIVLAASLPAPADRLYDMYLDPTLHGAFTGFPVTIAARAGGPAPVRRGKRRCRKFADQDANEAPHISAIRSFSPRQTRTTSRPSVGTSQKMREL